MMSVVKFIELSGRSSESFEDAVRQTVERASRTIRNIQSVWVKEFEGVIENNQVTQFRVILKVSYIPLIPEWFAHAEAITLKNGGIEVTVANRGAKEARNVTVSLWWREWPPESKPPLWNDGKWKRCGSSPEAKDVAPEKPETFGPFDVPRGATRYLVLLGQASCAADRANSDPLTSLPCIRHPTPLADLVASDNNL